MSIDHDTKLLWLERFTREATEKGLRVARGLRTETEGELAGKMISYVEISVVAR